MTPVRSTFTLAAAPVALVAALSALAAPASAQTRVAEISVTSPSLEGNLLGESVDRRAIVALPPSYDERSDARFPTLYLLHAFGVGPESWRGGPTGYEGMDIVAVLDSLVGAGAIREMIVVMPDARTAFGGSWYASSPAIGDWEGLIATDLVGAVDSAFRTSATREARAIAGQSMGGYGALRIAATHPETFATAVAISAPTLIETNPLGDAAVEAALGIPSPDAVMAGSPLPAVIWSKAAAFSADPESPPFYARLPMRVENGSLRADSAVLRRWEASTGLALARRAIADGGLLGVTLRLDSGRDDPLHGETLAFSDSLRALGLDHDRVAFTGGHVAGIREHLTRSVLPWISRRFDAVP